MDRKRSYTREFKITACLLVTEENVKPAAVAKNMGINVNMLYRWISEYENDKEGAFVGSGHLKPADAQLRKLQKENERLKAENEILKKAAAYFAKHPKTE